MFLNTKSEVCDQGQFNGIVRMMFGSLMMTNLNADGTTMSCRKSKPRLLTSHQRLQ